MQFLMKQPVYLIYISVRYMRIKSWDFLADIPTYSSLGNVPLIKD